ncbi:MAG: hypothetical protein R3C56_24125 [Pirellulaceae bacterium]
MRFAQKKMREVMVRFNTTPPGPQDRQMRSEWFAYHREGLPLYQRMLDAAAAEYQMAPSEKIPLAEMLWGILKRNAELDRYEGMLPIALALLENGFENPELRGIAARTAFALNEYAVMRKVATEMIDEGVASPNCKRCPTRSTSLNRPGPKSWLPANKTHRDLRYLAY